MRHAIKTDEGKILTMTVVSSVPALQEGWVDLGLVPVDLQDKKHLKLDVDGITLIEDAQEVEKTTLRAEMEEKARKGKLYKELADKILHIIAGHNIDNDLDAAQIASIKTSNPQVLEGLSDGQPYAVKPLIDAITPDGTVITADELTHVAEAYVIFAEINPELVPA